MSSESDDLTELDASELAAARSKAESASGGADGQVAPAPA